MAKRDVSLSRIARLRRIVYNPEIKRPPTQGARLKMGTYDPEPSLSEPVIIADIIVNGIIFSHTQHIARFVGWVLTPTGDNADERRIVIRFVMPVDAAKKLRADLSVLAKGDN